MEYLLLHGDFVVDLVLAEILQSLALTKTLEPYRALPAKNQK